MKNRTPKLNRKFLETSLPALDLNTKLKFIIVIFENITQGWEDPESFKALQRFTAKYIRCRLRQLAKSTRQLNP